MSSLTSCGMQVLSFFAWSLAFFGHVDHSDRPAPAATTPSSILTVDEYAVLTGINHDQTPYPDPGALLFRRDACSDALGAGRIDDICTPSSTLCCVESGQSYPQCQQFLGGGYCVTGSSATSGTYIDYDNPVANCQLSGAVACTSLAANTTESCCTVNTVCAPGYNASTTWARCNIELGVLHSMQASYVGSASSSISSTKSSTITTSTSKPSSIISTTAPAATTASSMSNTATLAASTSSTTASADSTNHTTSGLSTGALAAAVAVPVVALLVLGALITWWVLRNKKREERRLATVHATPEYSDTTAATSMAEVTAAERQKLVSHEIDGWSHPSELTGLREASELPGSHER